ncbi:hypothetical protein DFJ58DRAFT_749573 [Suillus subalutaceus]|uniref:uncharacterized protein n=1 Tax=Suillus subalutaceus TaxID=48586 RepID=UPI001B869DC9|nr:uncharacterized protein DFJ58DRAFT_749573 [Suillus subalutaceus]KAG1837187.1 hypothetical protein DFJ58DRAFT_749573 [Suillus subalutaceus]
MSAKIARRLSSLEPLTSLELSQTVVKARVCLRVSSDQRWEICSRRAADLASWAPETLSVLQGYSPFLEHESRVHTQALAEPSIALPISPVQPPANAHLPEAAHAAEPSISLIDFETAVRSGIDDWGGACFISEHRFRCISIECVLRILLASARSLPGKPGEYVNKLLILFELWVAMDKIVIKQLPLLANYPPEVPSTLWENLLIRKFSALIV